MKAALRIRPKMDSAQHQGRSALPKAAVYPRGDPHPPGLRRLCCPRATRAGREWLRFNRQNSNKLRELFVVVLTTLRLSQQQRHTSQLGDTYKRCMDRTPLSNTTSRLIAMAISLVGHAERVRSEMQCSSEDFRDYCVGHKELPWPELDRLIGLITRAQGEGIARQQEVLAKVRELQKSKD